MDQTQLQQNIAKYYAKLPVELQQFFSSMKWMEDLKNISTKYSLKEEQITTLGTETTLLLLGIIHSDEYRDILIKDLGLQEDVFAKIFDEINTLILKDNSDKLEEAFSLNVDSLLEEKYGGDKKLDERFASLPKEVQVAINESDYQTILYAIASKYKLSIEQMGTLEEVTTKVMLNIIHPDQYENELASKTTILKEDVSNIVKDVNEQILKTIREILKKHWDDGKIIKNEELEVKNENTKINKIEDDVPLPPYLKTESKIIESKPAENLVQNIITPTPISTENKEPIKPIQEITEIPKNIIEEKLKASTASSHTVSDYSLPSVNKAPSTPELPKSHDPYREAF